jgi:hypothetical protein
MRNEAATSNGISGFGAVIGFVGVQMLKSFGSRWWSPDDDTVQHIFNLG